MNASHIYSLLPHTSFYAVDLSWAQFPNIYEVTELLKIVHQSKERRTFLLKRISLSLMCYSYRLCAQTSAKPDALFYIQ